ncbi:MAG TPA: DUF2167 domain-containing protein [Woeseiaceae bacterium]|jgi:uncharacterized membrane-anchored protein|nr:DUF2167 domain-containing protein [Woeseiaceae bacterium]
MRTSSMRRLALIAVMLALPPIGAAEEGDEAGLTDEEQQQLAQMQAFWDSLDRQTGTIVLGDDLATLTVPEDFYFLNGEDAERVLVDVWGNPPGQDVLGMLFPAEYTPFDAQSWAVTVDYTEEGHVSDEDAAAIDYDELLSDMQDGVRDENPGRIDAGYEPIELLGWAEPPHYDPASRKLYWAKELRFGESPDTTLNYEIRALGRTGVLGMTFIAATSQLEEINAERESVLAMAEFSSGKRYEDFDSNIDEVAAYGIGALIAGKVAAKAGLFAAAAVLLKKVGIFILLGLAALGRKLKGLFSRSTTMPGAPQ